LPGAIPALVNLLNKGTYRGKKNAIVALFGLLLFPGNHPRVLATGIIPILIDLLIDEREDLVNDCVGVLAKIAERREGTKMILRSSSDVLQKLVQVLHSASSRSGKEYSVSLMLFLCLNGGQKVIKQLDGLPLLMPSLYSIIAGGPPQASKKARTLINHIHQIYDQDQDQDQDHSISALTSPLHDQMVHAL
ncbi:U-box domain-containing protein 18-like, partial [Asparagus officinalis]|uniref:U-box domain-containing protein 18-like n=1 Tax=Asparagus officinalis TaxID=4686 RepID=UPI00098E23A4